MNRKPKETTYGRGYAWTLVVFFTTASVALNGAHAVLGMAEASVWSRFWAVLTAILFPLAVLAETHFLVNLIREWDMRARWIAGLRMLCIVAVLVVAYIAFVRSFYALGDMATLMGIPAEDWWMLPASIDAMIILATLGVVIAEGQMALDRAEAVGAVSTVDVILPAPTTSADEVVGTASGRSDELADELVDELAGLPDDHPDDLVESWSTGLTTSVRHPVDLHVRPVDLPASASTTSTDELVDDFIDTPDELYLDAEDEVTDDRDERPDELGDEHRRRADEIIAASKISAAADELATVIALDAEGLSKQAIADRVGRSRSTITGWLKTSDEVDARRRPVLAAVH